MIFSILRRVISSENPDSPHPIHLSLRHSTGKIEHVNEFGILFPRLAIDRIIELLFNRFDPFPPLLF